MKSPACLTSIILLCAYSASAPAQSLVDASDADKLGAIIRDLGYRATVSSDGVGDPMISTRVGGTDVTILFYGCEDNENCRTLLFKVGYDLDDGTTLDVINAWNEMNLFGRAYLDDESDPWIEMAVNLYGGVSRANFEDTFDWWEVVIGQFEDHIGF